MKPMSLKRTCSPLPCMRKWRSCRKRIEEAQRWLRRRGKRRSDLDPPERLVRLRADLEEATRILNTLLDSRLLRPDA